jgi:mannose-1-phosphate guanylyltransferase/mannose-1-phosphate guanylyltransferase/mannose-6-phosphate isomerase
MFNDCIIMAGGSGTRLWPASNSRRPKQFLPISPDNAATTTGAAIHTTGAVYSFFSAAVERALAVIEDDGRVIIIAGKSHMPHVIAACAAFSAGERKRLVLIPEPAAKNTAPAIACAVIYSAGTAAAGTNRRMLVLTSDHIIQPLEQFRSDAAAAAFFAGQNRLAVFGIPPKNPDTGFGYIETGDAIPTADVIVAAGATGAVTAAGAGSIDGVLPLSRPGASAGTERLKPPEAFAVQSFREKPDRETAEQFLASGHFYWNSGMFGFSAQFMLAEFRRHAAEVIAPFEKLAAPGEDAYRTEQDLRILENWQGLDGAYRETMAISFDYAIAEKCEKTAMVRAGFNWIDIGNWDEYARLLSSQGNADSGSEVYRSGAEDCFVDSDIPVALAGVEGLIVTVRSGRDGNPPSVLIVKKGETQRLREIVEQIKKAGRTELL